MRLRTHTLGCKVNQYETEWVREGLVRAGYRDARDGETADLCVVNTCTVTQEGDAKSRQLIRRLARDNPHARIIVMGCYATRAPDEIAPLPGVCEVVRDKREIPDLLGRLGVVDLPDGISRFGNRHRAFVKVQDGCLLRCSYCIIPYVRPRMTSRPIDPILREVRRLVDRGYREIVLTGIHLGHYGVDLNRGLPKARWTRLSHLVERIANLQGNFRLRLSSMEAPEVTRELLAVMHAYPDRICPHLHICLQSGSDAVLRRMRRRWGARRIQDRCQLIQEVLDQPALTTDVIVGFPGETEADFAATGRLVRECLFSKVHVFPFSRRRGTPAATMPDQVPPPRIRERSQRLMQIERETREQYFRSLRHRTIGVLVESDDPIGIWGTSCRYAPVQLAAGSGQPGELIQAVVDDSHRDHLSGRPLVPGGAGRSNGFPLASHAGNPSTRGI